MNETVLKSGLLLLSAISLGIFLSYVSGDPRSATSKTYIYAFICIFPFLCLFLYLHRTSMPDVTGWMTPGRLIGSAVFMGICILLYYVFLSMGKESQDVIQYVFSYILMAAGALVGLAILSQLVLQRMIRRGGFPAFVARLIFFVPCWITKGIELFLQEYKTTPRVIQILFLLELGILILYAYLTSNLPIPSLASGGGGVGNGIVLLDHAVFLDNPTKYQIADADKLGYSDLVREHTNLMQTAHPNGGPANWTISFWIQLNHQQTKSQGQKALILSYDSILPRFVQFDFASQNLEFTLFTKQQDPYAVSLPIQKWNYVVISYQGLHADLFLNGVLKHTVQVQTPNEFRTTDTISVWGGNPLYGSISKIVYYPNTTFSTATVANLYNTTKKTP